jgi:hypothetical protein
MHRLALLLYSAMLCIPRLKPYTYLHLTIPVVLSLANTDWRDSKRLLIVSTVIPTICFILRDTLATLRPHLLFSNYQAVLAVTVGGLMWRNATLPTRSAGGASTAS